MARSGNGLRVVALLFISSEYSRARLRRNLKEKFRPSGRLVGKRGGKATYKFHENQDLK